MNLENIGYSKIINSFIEENTISRSNIGRVSAVYRDRFKVITEKGEINAVLAGNFLYAASDSTELPTVGDWVHLNNFDENQSLIIELLPRKNHLERRSTGSGLDSQIIAANIDYALIIDAVGENFKLNRIERFLAICKSSTIEPIILITKTDLATEAELDNLINAVSKRIKNVKALSISNLSGDGFNELKAELKRSKTYCLLGLSGVGKSTLINKLIGEDIIDTKDISASTNKGMHTTTHRELYLIDNGSIIIDNPGMREIGLSDTNLDVDSVFEKIGILTNECRFSNCSHTREKGCAVVNAIKNGELEKSQFDNYLKLKREHFHYTATVLEKRTRDKQFGKMVKKIKKTKPRKRY